MKKKIQNVTNFIFLLIGFILISIAIFPIVYFHVIFLDRKYGIAYYYFRNLTFHMVFLFSFIFFFLGFMFISSGISLFLRGKIKEPYSYKQSCYILLFIYIIEIFVMRALFPEAIIGWLAPN